MTNNYGQRVAGEAVTSAPRDVTMREFDKLPKWMRQELAAASSPYGTVQLLAGVRRRKMTREKFRETLNRLDREAYLARFPGIEECDPPGKVRY
jgi:hypothetical protein